MFSKPFRKLFILFSITLTPLFGHGERLSQWLKAHQMSNTYPLGLMWLVPEERVPESELKQCLIDQLSFYATKKKSTATYSSLLERINHMPVTGRANVVLASPEWLALHPQFDPILQANQSVSLPNRPQTVTVVLENGEFCEVPFMEGATADIYVHQCLGKEDSVDYAFVAQPDGRSVRYGIATWNEEHQEPLAPGAWIWAPRRTYDFTPKFSTQFIQFLATLGPAPTSSKNIYPAPPQIFRKHRNPEYTTNDWGVIGLMEMPSARMEKNGQLRFQFTNVYPYRLGSLIFQVFDWLEGGFHYVRIATKLYDPSHTISDLALYDKGFDIKLRLLKESAFLPQLAIGAQDMAGTSNFSGEYVVASKRYRDLDWTLGVAWGNLGAKNNIGNPFIILSDEFNQRRGMESLGGVFNIHSYLHGPASIFGGVQWHTPWDPLLFKLEYDSSYYKIGEIEKYWPAKSPINVGMVYRVFSNLDISAGLERGNTVMFGLNLHTALNKLNQPKLFEPPPPPIQLPNHTHEKQQIADEDWAEIATEINALTGWSVKDIAVNHAHLYVQIDGARTSFGGNRLNVLISILNNAASYDMKYFVITFYEYGMRLDEKIVNRDQWLKAHTEALPPSLNFPSIVSRAPETNPPSKPIFRSKYRRFSGTVAPFFSQTLGGPDAFFLYQAGVYGSGDLKLTPSTSVTGTVALRAIDNYQHFVYDAPSHLPRVRTNIRQYVETSWNTIPNLQLTQVKQVTQNQFVMGYGGLLEMMFAGVGGEWLYRPWHSPLAVGVDLNYVQQRGFSQHFDFLDYRVATGQVTLYWNTGWKGILAQLSAGQYLAGDRGVGIDLSRRFNNGVVVGVYAYKTNVSAAQFGEGSFNKGAYISIPFDSIMPISTPGAAYFNWQPLLRDGGAQLNRAIRLYDLTSERSRNASYFDP